MHDIEIIPQIRAMEFPPPPKAELRIPILYAIIIVVQFLVIIALAALYALH